MRKNVFSKSLRILIVTLLLLVVLVPRQLSQNLMLAAVAIWILFTITSVLRNRLKRKSSKTDTLPAVFQSTLRKIKNFSAEETFPEPVPAPFTETPSAPLAQKEPFLSETEFTQMLLHIRLRITDKLKSAYTDAIWQWEQEPDLHSVLAGKTIRIIVENMDSYTHADISFDRFGRIHVEPMTIGSFATADNANKKDDLDLPSVPEPPIVDVRVWYELIGQKILTEQITELHAKGHSKLTIMENGDITVKNQKKEVLKATLDSFPTPNYWQELVSVLAEDELTAKITGNSLQVSWI